MNHRRSKTAILYFALSSDKAAKKLSTNKKQFAGLVKLFDQVTKKVQSLAAKLELPLYHHDEHHQRGDTFGTKVEHSVNMVLEEGYDQVVVIGNDHIDLTIVEITTLIDLISEDNGIAAIPARDGGIAALAISKDMFRKGVIPTLPWMSSDLFRAIQETSNVDLTQHFEIKQDLDRIVDLHSWLHKLRIKLFPSKVIQIVKDLIGGQEALFLRDRSLSPQTICKLTVSRGPPVRCI